MTNRMVPMHLTIALRMEADEEGNPTIKFNVIGIDSSTSDTIHPMDRQFNPRSKEEIYVQLWKKIDKNGMQVIPSWKGCVVLRYEVETPSGSQWRFVEQYEHP